MKTFMVWVKVGNRVIEQVIQARNTSEARRALEGQYGTGCVQRIEER